VTTLILFFVTCSCFRHEVKADMLWFNSSFYIAGIMVVLQESRLKIYSSTKKMACFSYETVFTSVEILHSL